LKLAKVSAPFSVIGSNFLFLEFVQRMQKDIEKKFIDGFSNLFKDKKLSDFEISIKNTDKNKYGDDSYFSVHLAVLIQRWSHFRKQHIEKPTKEEIIEKTKKLKNKKKTFQNLKASIVKKILFFLYTNNLSVFHEEQESNLDEFLYHIEKMNVEEEYYESCKIQDSIVSNQSYISDFEKQFDFSEKDKMNDNIVIKYAMDAISDFKIVSMSGEVPCHRCILTHQSDYFKSMFSENWSQENELKLEQIDINDIRMIIKFIYSSKIDLNIENCVGISICSNMFSLDNLERESLKYLTSNLNMDIVFDALSLSESIESPLLKDECLKFLIKRCLGDLEKIKEFQNQMEHEKHKNELFLISQMIKYQNQPDNSIAPHYARF
jgi:hypothetical protein